MYEIYNQRKILELVYEKYMNRRSKVHPSGRHLNKEVTLRTYKHLSMGLSLHLSTNVLLQETLQEKKQLRTPKSDTVWI